jgi:hypothetical protein
MPSSIWRPDSGNRSRHLGLWAGLLGPPLLWLTLLETNYVLAYEACGDREKWFLYLAVAVSILIGAAAGIAAWKSGPPADDQDRSDPWTLRTREIRARWMSAAAVACTAWFLVVMLAMAVPAIVLRTCD